jgi:hypothetical protein
MDILSILFTFAVATLSSILAESKNRNGAIWFILGLVFNVFALLVLVFLRKKEDLSCIKRCFYCGKDVDCSDGFCPFCKNELDI